MAYDDYRDAMRIYQEQEQRLKQQRAAFEGPALSLGEKLATASAMQAFDPATACVAVGMDHSRAMAGLGHYDGVNGGRFGFFVVK